MWKFSPKDVIAEFQVVLVKLTRLSRNLPNEKTSLNITICWSFLLTLDRRFCALVCFVSLVYWPRWDKTCLRGFHQRETQTSILKYRDYLEKPVASLQAILCLCCLQTQKSGYPGSRPIAHDMTYHIYVTLGAKLRK